MQVKLRPPVRQSAPVPSVPMHLRRPKAPMFVFGLGAAKCGTTWLYEYLRAHPECHVRGYKELHFFDTVEKARMARSLQPVTDALQVLDRFQTRARDQLATATPADQARKLREVLDIKDFRHVLETCHQDRHAYVKYMMTGLKQERLVADITPDYAYLLPDMLSTMLGVSAETRFIYIMRDPVARFWSHVRMHAKRSLPDGGDFADHARALLAAAMADKDGNVRVHSGYQRTLTNMRQAIPEDRRLVMFYEDLMTPAGLKRLCLFLKITPLLTEFERPVLKGRAAEMTDAERAALRRLLRPEYEFVASQFPDLPKAWKATMAEGFA